MQSLLHMFKRGGDRDKEKDRDKDRDRGDRTGAANDEVAANEISGPTDVEQALHIEFDQDRHLFRGVPSEWQHAFPAAETVRTRGTLGPHLAPPLPDPATAAAAHDAASAARGRRRVPHHHASTSTSAAGIGDGAVVSAFSTAPNAARAASVPPPRSPLPSDLLHGTREDDRNAHSHTDAKHTSSADHIRSRAGSASSSMLHSRARTGSASSSILHATMSVPAASSRPSSPRPPLPIPPPLPASASAPVAPPRSPGHHRRSKSTESAPAPQMRSPPSARAHIAVESAPPADLTRDQILRYGDQRRTAHPAGSASPTPTPTTRSLRTTGDASIVPPPRMPRSSSTSRHGSIAQCSTSSGSGNSSVRPPPPRSPSPSPSMMMRRMPSLVSLQSDRDRSRRPSAASEHAPSIPDLPAGSAASMIVSPPPRVSSGSLTPPAALAAAIARRTAAAGSAKTSAPSSPALSCAAPPALPTDDRPASPEPVAAVAVAADADIGAADNEPPADEGGNEDLSDRGMSPVPFTLSRRMSKRYKDRKSKVMTMVPSRQSLLDTVNVLSAMAAAHPTDDDAPTLPDMPDHWRARLASIPDDGPVVPAPTIPLPDLPTASTADQESTRRESRWSGPTVIHPALLKFIEESERLDRERSSSAPQPERTPGSSSNDLTALIAAAAVTPESGLAQMLHDGSLAPHELEAIASLQVTPATLAVALDAFVESQDPASLFTDVTPYAEGNSGDVYVARDAVIQTTVAIKIIPRDADRSRDKVARLPLEIYLSPRVASPDLVAFIGAYLTPTDVWVVSEFMTPGCLADYLYDDDDAIGGGLYATGLPT
ncbi:hypothetical protein AMAG_17180 [Allomyces macrogynus ATCC 38327]|uniref:Protein kinase domain-containing protein n=1 Tax=Allomyces macrogynus (strain ATCC 38327) TaxID=578462 RepID=A0A0L0TEE1_ALLM3|nr:hypothetical protein AMAG_17180 [Allomyces macrogynus ATCC 38327]|eukprot:KNE72949.1 hypothetical protein AMAG_17180 [Allomyces macrogynus ATCC 38327]